MTNKNVVLSLLLITFYVLLSYLLFTPFLGLYGDDWFYAYIGHFFNSSGLINTVVMERPFAGYSLALNHILLGNNIFLWHTSMVLMRLFGGYALFIGLKSIWPNKLSAITSITILFLTYPGFLQQQTPIGYLTILTDLTLWIFSLTLSILAIKKDNQLKYILIISAVVLQGISILVMEYFIGMEVLRLLLIFYVIKTQNNKFNKTFLKMVIKKYIYWVPYLLFLVAFIFWRIFMFNSGRETTNIDWVAQTYYSNPLWIITRPLELIYSLLSTVILAYFVPIIIRFIRIPLQYSMISILVGILSSILLFLYFRIIQKAESKEISGKHTFDNTFGRDLIIIGFISILGSLAPIIISGRFVRLFYTFDRYTITSMVSVGFILVGLLNYQFWFLNKIQKIIYNKRNFIVAILISLSVTTQLMNGYFNILSWNEQKNIWWQLYWRSPKIQNNTMLIFDFPELTNQNIFNQIVNKLKWNRFYWVDYQIYGPGNLFFNYDDFTSNYITGDYLSDTGVIEKINNKTLDISDNYYTPYIKGFRNTRDYNKAVIISTPNDSSCLWAIDGIRNEYSDNSNKLLQSNTELSNIHNLVQQDASANIPLSIFGSEPEHSWCYYFEKASLARQFNEWDKLLLLISEVQAKNLRPKDPNEWLPFIEGLLVSKKYDQAEILIKDSSSENSQIFKNNVCKTFLRLQDKDINNKKISDLKNDFCQ